MIENFANVILNNDYEAINKILKDNENIKKLLNNNDITLEKSLMKSKT